MLDEGDVGLDQAGGRLVVLLTGARIERLDELERGGNGLNRPANHLGDFLVLLHLHRAQVLVDDAQSRRRGPALVPFPFFCCRCCCWM